jgi:hypothetical protein
MLGLNDIPEMKVASRHQKYSLAIFSVLTILCALSFLQYLGWAAFYSGNPAAGDVAGHKAELFFWVFVIFEVLAALVMASRTQLAETFSSNRLRLMARCGIGLLLSVFATAVVVGLLVLIGRGAHL